MTKIVVDIRLQSEVAERLKKLPGVEIAPAESSSWQRPARDLPVELIRDAEILVCAAPPRNHQEMQNLKLVQLSTVGFAQLYSLDLPQRGVRACNARGVYDTSIAEWTIAMMINLARDLRSMIRQQEHGIWNVEGRFASELGGSVVGLWGYGGIGRETARLAKTMGMRIHAMVREEVKPRGQDYVVPGTGDPEGKLPDRVFKAGEEIEFLKSVDFLVLSMPLTPANTGLLGERELRALKPTAFLLNPARGALVQEAALLKALRENWFAGAALDTHYYYPMPADHPLWRFPNVIMTPHISGSDRGPHFLDRIWEIIEHNVRQYLAGQPLWNELSTAELKGG